MRTTSPALRTETLPASAAPGRAGHSPHLTAPNVLAVVLHAAAAGQDDWNPAEDEPADGFDIHLGVYATD